jgi:two-component system cell cycle response regulator
VNLIARILIIEDNPTNLELMMYLLSAFGYKALTAMDGLDGIEVAQRERPDLIVCDVQLPKADGFEVVRRLKGQTDFAKTPVIAVTALAMVGDRERLLHAGFNGYLAKPIEPENFVGQVEAFLPSELRAKARQQGTWSVVPEEPRPAQHLGRVLVVDDTRANRELLRSLLEPHGYTVAMASSVEEAEEEVRRARPDLIIADVHLRDGTSLDFIQNLRDGEMPLLPVLIQSASALETDRKEIRAMKGVKLLNRPLDAERLLVEIQEALSPKGTLAGAHAQGGSRGDDPGGRRPAVES